LNCDSDIECTAIVTHKSMNSLSLHQLSHRQRGKNKKKERGRRERGETEIKKESERDALDRENGKEG